MTVAVVFPSLYLGGGLVRTHKWGRVGRLLRHEMRKLVVFNVYLAGWRACIMGGREERGCDLWVYLQRQYLFLGQP